MSGRPQQDRRNVDGVEYRWRHPERARGNRNKSPDRRHEARKKYRERSPTMKERLALGHQPRIIRKRPGFQDFALLAVSEQKGGSIAQQGAGDRGQKDPPQF